MDTNDTRSGMLPTDPFDMMLDRLKGLPNGAHTAPVVRQAQDFYGNVTQYIIQTVRHDEGDTAFITLVNAEGRARFVLPPVVLDTLTRQQDTVSTMVRRRHGKRLAEERKAAGVLTTFTPEARAKGLAARRRKAAAKRQRKD